VNIINRANVILKIFKLSEELVVLVVAGLSDNSHLAGFSPTAATNEHTLPAGTSVASEQAAWSAGFAMLAQASLWI